MRIFSFLVAALIVLSPSLALAGKKKTERKVEPRPDASVVQPPCRNPIGGVTVGENTDGYRKVTVMLVLPLPTIYAREELKFSSAGLVFGMKSDAKSFRPNHDNQIVWIDRCEHDNVSASGKFYAAGTTWLKVKAVISREARDGADSLIFASVVYLPSEVVDAGPEAFTTVFDPSNKRDMLGVFKGDWSESSTGAVLTLRLK